MLPFSKIALLPVVLLTFCLTLTASEFPLAVTMKREIVLELPPGPDNPRNSEGDFIRLKDGRILFIYSKYFGASANDHAHANLAGICSSDEGKTWSEPQIIVKMDGGLNVMSVSLLRLQDGRIALFYLRKYALDDCRPWLCFSSDEGKSWSKPTCCFPEAKYYVVNNARIIQLRDGSIVIPACWHEIINVRHFWPGQSVCFISKDGGKSFQQGEFAEKTDPKLVFQEPGVVEMNDGRLFMFIRTASGTQFTSFSSDGGKTWDAPAPSKFVSPCSPMLIRPIPDSKRFLAVWNESPNGRNPLTVAILDENMNFLWKSVLDQSEGAPPQWFCYPAILALNQNEFLISYCAGVMPGVGLEKTRLVKIRLDY